MKLIFSRFGEVHHHRFGTRVLHELGDGRTHSGGTTNDEGALAVEAKGAECTHVLSPRSQTILLK